MDYDPKAPDDGNSKIPAEFEELQEIVAARVHDMWAWQRMREGWKYGPKRSDSKREHPCLIPYDQLPDSEKEYDRVTARTTIRTILEQGFILTPPEMHDGGECEHSPLEACRRYSKNLRRAGEALRCYDEVTQGLKRWGNDLRLLQLKALALADIGVTDEANKTVLQLREEGHDDEETLSILGRTYKDLWQQASVQADRAEYLEKAYKTYKECFDLTGGYYPGINAATLATLHGEADIAAGIAEVVRDQCLEKLTPPADPGEEYYLVATLAEAYLNLGDMPRAVEYYARAGEVGRGLHRDLHATRRNARLLLAHFGLDPAPVEKALFIPPVGVFVGHNIDRPGRPEARFPDRPDLDEAVFNAIRDAIRRLKIGFGYSSAAAGGDLLFQKALMAEGVEANVVLPYNLEHFEADNVSGGGRRWADLFREVMGMLEQRQRLEFASEWPVGEGPDVFDYANRVLFGMAILKARHLDTGLVPIVLWDGRPGDGPGGTASAAKWWEGQGHRVERIDLEAIRAGLSGDGPVDVAAPAAATPALRSRPAGKVVFPVATKAILFADVVGYSKMPEDLVPLFVDHFMGGVARRLGRYGHPPEFKNTWGDAVYFIFDSIRDAGLHALDLIDFVVETDWEKEGLPKNLDLRIALHAGPVHACKDPVVGIDSFTGTHVNRAARIEPITPPGHVFASQAFAALAAAEGIEDFTCDYVGRVELAKRYGVFSTYHVRRRV